MKLFENKIVIECGANDFTDEELEKMDRPISDILDDAILYIDTRLNEAFPKEVASKLKLWMN